MKTVFMLLSLAGPRILGEIAQDLTSQGLTLVPGMKPVLGFVQLYEGLPRHSPGW